MCSLVMSLCSCDLYVISLNNNYYNTLNSSRLAVVQLTQRLVFGWYNINLFELDVATCMTQRKSDPDMRIDPTWFQPCPALSYSTHFMEPSKAFYIMEYTVRFLF